MQLLAFLLCAVAMVMTFGASVLWQGLRHAPIAIEDETGFHVVHGDDDPGEYHGCDVERHTLWP